MQEGAVAGADIADWPCGVGILCKFTAFLGTLHMPVGSEDMGHFGVSYLELLIIFEQWLVIGCSVKRYEASLACSSSYFFFLCACFRGN